MGYIELKMTPVFPDMSGTAGHPTPVQGQHAIALLPCPQTVGSTGRFRRVASQARDVPGQHVIGGFGGASLAGDPNNYSGWHGRVDLVTTAQNTGGSEVCGGRQWLVWNAQLST